MTDLREEIKKYINYLKRIKDQEYPIPGGSIHALERRNGANAEKKYQLEEVVKSLEAILDKTERTYY